MTGCRCAATGLFHPKPSRQVIQHRGLGAAQQREQRRAQLHRVKAMRSGCGTHSRQAPGCNPPASSGSSAAGNGLQTATTRPPVGFHAPAASRRTAFSACKSSASVQRSSSASGLASARAWRYSAMAASSKSSSSAPETSPRQSSRRWRDWYSVSRSSSVHRWSVLPMRRNAPLGRPVALVNGFVLRRCLGHEHHHDGFARQRFGADLHPQRPVECRTGWPGRR